MFKPFPVICVTAALCVATAFSQTAISSNQPVSGAVAYVYVSSSPGSGSNQIYGFAAAANGALLPLPNSPFAQNESSLAVKGKYLVGANQNQGIDSFTVNSDGSLTYAASASCAQGVKYPCDSAGALNFDNTGTSVYMKETYSATGHRTNSYSLDQTNGALAYLGQVISGDFQGNVSFLPNNVLAFSASDDSCAYAYIDEYRRQSSGLLTLTNATFQTPKPPPGVNGYYADIAAADPAGNYVAMVEQPVNPPFNCAPGYPVQMATFSVGTNGNLNTTSTYQNMPSTAIIDPQDMQISPSGKLLAVGGAEGLELYHFNGANPVTAFGGVLTSDAIVKLWWDNNNHLYAISNTADKLYVLTVTPEGISQAPGSPHVIANPQGLAVNTVRYFSNQKP